MGKHNDLSDFDRGHTVMARQLGLKLHLSIPGLQWSEWSKVIQGRDSGEPVRESREANAHIQIHMGIKGRPLWADPTEELM